MTGTGLALDEVDSQLAFLLEERHGYIDPTSTFDTRTANPVPQITSLIVLMCGRTTSGNKLGR